MSRVVANLIADIERLVADRDLAEVETAVESLASAVARGEGMPSDAEARSLLQALRSKRQFASMARLGEVLIAHGMTAERPRRLYAQALIDSNRLDDAEKVLLRLVRDAKPDSGEWKEARGLIGRVFKQRYVDADRRPPAAADVANLQRAINEYGDVVARGRLADDHWHVINFIALTARARRDGVDPGHDVPAEALADALIATLAPIASTMPVGGPEEDIWLLASLGEAHVAKGDFAKARDIYARYARNPAGDAFEVFSSLRQLVEVWGLARSGLGSEVIAILETRLGELVAEGAVLGAPDVDRLARVDIRLGRPGERMERGRAETPIPVAAAPRETPTTPASKPMSRGPSVVDVQWLIAGADRAKAVAVVRHRSYGSPAGSGFLVRGSDLHPALGDEVFLLTNSHVSGALPGAGLAPREAVAEFVGSGARAAFREVVWESRVDLLDAALVRLDKPPAGIMPVAIASLTEHPDDLGEIEEAELRGRLVGISGDAGVNVTFDPFPIRDLGYADPARPGHVYMHHDAPTRDGSSGSPLFDEAWHAIALHRAATPPGGRVDALGGRPGNRSTRIAVTLKSIARQIALDRGDTARAQALAPRVSGATPSTVAPAVPSASSARLPPASVEELQRLVEAGEVSEELLDNLLDYNVDRSEPFAPACTLRSTPDGTTPQGIGEAVAGVVVEGASSLARAIRNVRFQKRGLTLLSDGDSWFQFPVPRVRDTIDHLSGRHSVYCLAGAGNILGKISAEIEDRLVPLVQKHKPHGILLSGGGNDLLGYSGMTNHVSRYKPGEKAANHVVAEQLERTLDNVQFFYKRIIDELLRVDPKLKVFCHGYDWAIPDAHNGGAWLNRPLLRAGIQDPAMQREIVKLLIDRFNERMAGLETTYKGSVFFVDCRGAVGESRKSWFDELHPLTPGFHRVAMRFRRRFADVFDPELLKVNAST